MRTETTTYKYFLSKSSWWLTWANQGSLYYYYFLVSRLTGLGGTVEKRLACLPAKLAVKALILHPDRTELKNWSKLPVKIGYYEKVLKSEGCQCVFPTWPIEAVSVYSSHDTTRQSVCIDLMTHWHSQCVLIVWSIEPFSVYWPHDPSRQSVCNDHMTHWAIQCLLTTWPIKTVSVVLTTWHIETVRCAIHHMTHPGTQCVLTSWSIKTVSV